LLGHFQFRTLNINACRQPSPFSCGLYKLAFLQFSLFILEDGIWVIIITIILLSFTTLYFIGLRAMANQELRLEGFGLEDAEKAEGTLHYAFSSLERDYN